MPSVTVYCSGRHRIKIPIKASQISCYDTKYGQGTLKWLYRTTARRPISMGAIANKLGVTLQAVSVFYCHYVKPHIPPELLVESVARSLKPKSLSWPSNLVTLARRVARHGLAARPIAKKNGGAYRRSISINDWVCRVLRTRPNHPGGYAGFPLISSNFEAHNFFIITLRQINKPSVYYVIPVGEIERLLNGRTILMVYIPTRSHKIRRPRAIDWDRYRSAWHLLNKRR